MPRGPEIERAPRAANEANDALEPRIPAALYDQVAESVAVYTREGVCLYANDATSQTLGRPREQLVGRVLWDIIPEAVGNPFYLAFRRVASSGVAEQFEYFATAPARWFSHRILRADGLLWVVAVDVTRQRRALAIEEAAKQRLKLLADASQAIAEAGLDARGIVEVAARQVVPEFADACCISLISADGEWLDPVAFADADGSLQQPFFDLSARARLRVGEGVTGRLVQSGGSLLLPVISRADFAAQVHPEYESLLAGWESFGLVAAPLRHQKRVLGGIFVARRAREAAYTEEDEQLMQQLADRIAIALENARLHRESALEARVLESMGEGVSLADEQGIILYTNPAEDRMFGYARGELIGKHVTVQNTYAPAENQRVVSEVISELKQRGLWSGEFSNVKKDGTPFVTRAIITAIELDHKPHWVCVQEDVSLRKRAERRAHALSRISAELAGALSEADVASAVVGRTHDLLEAAASVAYARGASGELRLVAQKGVRADAIERIAVMPPELPLPLNAALASREPVWLESREQLLARFPAIFELLEGPGPESLVALPLMAEGRDIGGIAFSFASATRFDEPERTFLRTVANQCAQALERARLYQSERLAREEAQRRAEFEQQVIGIVSHDLRTPINAVGMSAALLIRRGNLDTAQATGLARIVAASERANRMIRDFLDFTQARVGGGLPIAPTPGNLHEIARSVLDEVHLSYPEREAKLTQLGDGQGEWDADRLAQVIGNLITNAFQHSPSDLAIEVITRGVSGGAELEVKNGGPPIPSAQLGTLFTPFMRGSQGRRRVSGSIGLGLYISRKIIEAHGGNIAVHSSSEEGTRFHVALPRKPPHGEG